jgi:hypothetical protein
MNDLTWDKRYINKNLKLSIVVQVGDPATGETETRGLQVQGRLSQLSEILSQNKI